jgi:PAS domain S-box-containing protein
MSPTTAEAVWILAERPAREHIAQLYSGDVALLESLRIFTGHGLSRGESVILLVTAPHRDALLRLLRADGFDVDQAQHDGRLVILDAAQALAGFIRNGMPDVALFRTQIGSVIERVRSNLGHQSLRVFGEMVDLLWKSNLAAAIRLERMWNDLIEEFDLSLFCAYSTTHAHDSFPEAVRTPHSHIITSAMADSSDDAIVGHSLDRRIVCWNRGAERMYGHSAAEAIGQPSALMMPDGYDDLTGVIGRIQSGEHVAHYEAKRLRKDGSVVDVSVAVTPSVPARAYLLE